MRRPITSVIVQLLFTVLVFLSADVASAQTKKVACVGDSITAFPGGWCTNLGTALGSGYMTQTFGVSGTTLLKNVGQPAFSTSEQYKPSHDFAPDIVVIMLGTNDSMPRNWNAGKSHFEADYKELIDSYKSLATKPLVILNTAPPASNDNMFTISGMNIEKEVNPLIKKVAMDNMCPVADVWAACGGDVSKLGSSDGVHPGAAGNKIIGETVAKVIMNPVIPGASAGAAGASGSAGAAGQPGGKAGAGAAAGASASAAQPVGSANTAGAGAVAPATAGSAVSTAGAGAAAKPSTGAVPGGSPNTGSTATRGNASTAGGAAPTNTAGTSSTASGVTAATSTPASPEPENGGCGCRMTGNSPSKSGPTAALLLLLGIAIRSRSRISKRNRTRPAADLD